MTDTDDPIDVTGRELAAVARAVVTGVATVAAQRAQRSADADRQRTERLRAQQQLHRSLTQTFKEADRDR